MVRLARAVRPMKTLENGLVRMFTADLLSEQ
jgi:hypothetical protein